MVQRRGPRLTAAQKAELWCRWREGESLNAIGRALGRIPKMVRYVVAGVSRAVTTLRRRATSLGFTVEEARAAKRQAAPFSRLLAIHRDVPDHVDHPFSSGRGVRSLARYPSSAAAVLRSGRGAISRRCAIRAVSHACTSASIQATARPPRGTGAGKVPHETR